MRVEDSIVAYLNKIQPFRIGFDTTNIIYSYGKFYRPQLNIFKTANTMRQLDLLSIFTTMDELTDIASEKGKNCKTKGKGWEDGCLFDIIDNYDAHDEMVELRNLDHLVCDDMGTEIADFIAVSNNKNAKSVILIHAKVNARKAKYSAKAFQEVCAQAIKSLGWINPYSENANKSLNKWEDAWTADGVGGKVENRIRIGKRIRNGKVTPKQVWDDFTNVIRDPQSNKEVWIMLGKGFSLSDFEIQRGKKNPHAEIVHIFYILQSTWNIVDSVGAKLRIFCSP